MGNAFPSPPIGRLRPSSTGYGEGGRAEANAERGRVGKSSVMNNLPTRPLRGHPPLAGRDGTEQAAQAWRFFNQDRSKTPPDGSSTARPASMTDGRATVASPAQ